MDLLVESLIQKRAETNKLQMGSIAIFHTNCYGSEPSFLTDGSGREDQIFGAVKEAGVERYRWTASVGWQGVGIQACRHPIIDMCMGFCHTQPKENTF